MEKIRDGATIWARQTIESEIFFHKPDKWFKIWFYIIQKVNHKDNHLFKRAENFFTYREIQKDCRATHGMVDKFIRWAKQSTMLSTRKSTRGLVITVLNYDKFQNLKNYGVDTKVDTPVEVQSKRSRNKVDTINKYERMKEKDIEFFPQANQTVDHLYKRILENKPDFKVPNRAPCLLEAVRMFKADNRALPVVLEVIDFATSDDFWKPNILSVTKLRKKFDTLEMQMNKNKPKETSW